jgi:hypothetical protein
MKKKPLNYYEERDYIIDDAFFAEYKDEVMCDGKMHVSKRQLY